VDREFIFNKARGSFAKRPSQRGIGDSEPRDLFSTIQIITRALRTGMEIQPLDQDLRAQIQLSEGVWAIQSQSHTFGPMVEI
jgi:hypothetical protein